MNDVLRKVAKVTEELYRVVETRYPENLFDAQTRVKQVFPLFATFLKVESGELTAAQAEVKASWFLQRYLGSDADKASLSEYISALKSGEFDILSAAWQWLWTEEEWRKYYA